MAEAEVSTVIIFTTRMAEMAAFYQRAFEFEPAQATGDDHLGFRLPHLYLGFDQVAEPLGQGPSAVSLWFEVADLEQTFQRLVGMGAGVRYGPTHKPWGAFLACVYDLDGNMIGLSQRLAQEGDPAADGSEDQ